MMFAATILAASTLAAPAPIPNVPAEHQAAVRGAIVRLSLANICEQTDDQFRDADAAALLLERALVEARYPDASRAAKEAADRAAAATPADARLGRNLCDSLSRTIADELND